MLDRFWRTGALIAVAATIATAQTQIDAASAQKILDRLDRLETENNQLLQEIVELRKELESARATPAPKQPESVSAQPPASASTQPAQPASPQPQQAQIEEQLQVQETRTAELDQKKVESSQKMPLQVTGMLLFNAFDNGAYSGNSLPDPVTASTTAGDRYAGATFRQTVLGLTFSGPQLPFGGSVSGSVYMDFFGGAAAPGSNLFRLRLATVNLNWKNTTISVGQDKPIISPREPVSLAEVGVSPLTGAGNLWQWEPQARIEQRFHLTDEMQIVAQGGVYMSDEGANVIPTQFASTLEPWRPAYQGRVEFAYAPGTERFEIAPGYSASTTHVIGQSVDSRVASLDWLARPSKWWDFTGEWFVGRNFAGLGSLRQGFTILSPDEVIPVHGYGAWGQITLYATPRWSFHFFGGEEDDRAQDLAGNAISRNLIYGANTIYRLAPNVLTAFEFSQVRTVYLISGLRQNNHYDLALAYLF